MTAIEFENISKQYRLGLVSTGTLSHDLNRFWQTKVLRREAPYIKVGEVNDRAHKGASEYVWALKNINFKVDQGDVVGMCRTEIVRKPDEIMDFSGCQKAIKI